MGVPRRRARALSHRRGVPGRDRLLAAKEINLPLSQPAETLLGLLCVTTFYKKKSLHSLHHGSLLPLLYLTKASGYLLPLGLLLSYLETFLNINHR